MTNKLLSFILWLPFIACANKKADTARLPNHHHPYRTWELSGMKNSITRTTRLREMELRHRRQQMGLGNNELQHYTAYDSLNAYVHDGLLTITARIDSMGRKRYTSARLITKGKGDWLYGRFESRAKLPTGVGTWPAIWMLPTDIVYGGWPDSGEIDIMENGGYDPV